MVRLEAVKSSKSKTSKVERSNKENSSLGLWETDPYDDEETQNFDMDVATTSVVTSKSKLSKFKKASGRLLLSSKSSATTVLFGEHKISSSALNVQEIAPLKLVKEGLEKVPSDPKRKTSLKSEKSKIVSPLFNYEEAQDDENDKNNYDNKNNKKSTNNSNSSSSGIEKETKSSLNKISITEEVPKRKTSIKEKSNISAMPLVACFKEISLESKIQPEPKRKSSLHNKTSSNTAIVAGVSAVAAVAAVVSAIPATAASKTDCEKLETRRKTSLKDKKRRSNGDSDQNSNDSNDNNELKENDHDSSKRRTSLHEKSKSLEPSVKSSGRASRATSASSSASSCAVSTAAAVTTTEFVKPSAKIPTNRTQTESSTYHSSDNNNKNTTKRTKTSDFLSVPSYSSSVVVSNTNKIQKLENRDCCSSSSRSSAIILSPSSFSSYPLSSLARLSPFLSPAPKPQVAAEEKKAKMRKVIKARLQVLGSKDMMMLIARYLPGLELVRISLVNRKYQSLVGDPNHRLWENLCIAAVRKFRVPKRDEDSWRRRYCQSLAICEACDLYAPTGDGVVACICCSAQYCDFNPPAGHVRFPSTPSVVPVAPRKVGMCYEQCWMLCWRCNDLIVMQNKKGYTGAVCRACCPPDRDVCEQCRETILLARTKPQWQTRRDEHKVARVLGLSDTMGEFMEFEDDNRSVTSQARYERHVPEDSILETSTIFDPYC